MPLAMMGVGQTARVLGVSGSDKVRNHLGNLGFSAGTVIRIVQDNDGNKIVGVHDSRLAINEDLARRINVEPM